jgi:DNA replication protein DnaC
VNFMHIEATLTQLRSMHLTRMAESFQERISRGDHNNIPCEDFFAILVEDEYCSRQSKKQQRLIAKADFKPEGACLENVTYSPARGFQKKDLLQFTTELWIKQAHNVVICGPTGTGKTFVAEAIGLQACKMGHSTRKIRFKKLFEEINAARGTGQYLKHLERLQKTRVLIIDDYLMSDISTEDAAHLFEIIEERTQIGPLIVTTQYPIGEWHKRLPDPTVADAICDRLAHTAIQIDLKGESMRKANTKSHSK